MKVTFIRDYRGKATNEVFHPAGAVADFPKEIADYLASVEAVKVVKPARNKKAD